MRLAGFDPVVWNVEVIPGLVSLDRRRLALKVGERGSLTARVTDENGSRDRPRQRLPVDQRSPRGRAGLGKRDVVDGLGLGRAVVTAKAPWGRSDSADVFVVSDAVVASNRSGAYGIYQFRASPGDTLVPLLVDGATNVQPVYSPDRTRLVFSSNRSGSYDLFVMDADGRNLSRITTDSGNESEPRWTPDGSRIVYTSHDRPADFPRSAASGLAGQDDRSVISAPGGNQSPAVSRDGRQDRVRLQPGRQSGDLPVGPPERRSRGE